jgi:hypothetical protein
MSVRRGRLSVRSKRLVKQKIRVSVETEMLTSWNAGAARQAVVEFAQRVVSDDVPVDERVAVFDNDGTLWCEKPLPTQADFIIPS